MKLRGKNGTPIADNVSMRRPFALYVLVLLGMADLGSTLWWHSQGSMTEMNPLMRPMLESDPWLFSAVKIATLAALWLAVSRHTTSNPRFCRTVCALGAASYGVLWCGWVAMANLA